MANQKIRRRGWDWECFAYVCGYERYEMARGACAETHGNDPLPSAPTDEIVAVRSRGGYEPLMALPKVDVLRCLGETCGGMLAYEVTEGNVLYVDLAYTARRDGEVSYFPCPSCGGRNVVEEFTDAGGATAHRVARFEPAS
jgi:hypothetical protein